MGSVHGAVMWTGQGQREPLSILTGCLKRFIKATVSRELLSTGSFSTLHPAHIKGEYEGHAKSLTSTGSGCGSRQGEETPHSTNPLMLEEKICGFLHFQRCRATLNAQ